MVAVQQDRPLTERETEVFQLIVKEGLDNYEIADRLGLAVRTVKFHAGHVLEKYGFPDRVKLAIAFWNAKRGSGIKSNAVKSNGVKSNGRAHKSATAAKKRR